MEHEAATMSHAPIDPRLAEFDADILDLRRRVSDLADRLETVSKHVREQGGAIVAVHEKAEQRHADVMAVLEKVHQHTQSSDTRLLSILEQLQKG